ncbi:MAG TPA: CsbD family protein [Streptosporangiaceae bacterium]|jgi:uncharacterized protein YjbJ (UPF0337 family)
MGAFENAKDRITGKAKEAAGTASGDEELADEGRVDQAKADVKDAAKKAGDKLGDAAEKAKDAFRH